MAPVVIIYRDQLLPFSETFIRAQVNGLRAYQGCYVGTTRLHQLALTPQPSLCLGDYTVLPGLWKTALKLGHLIHPGWLRQIRALAPVLVHAHFGLDALWARLLAQRLHLPLIITFRGNDVTGMQASRPGHPPRWAEFMHQRGQFFRDYYLYQRPGLFQDAVHCLAVSEFLRQQLIAVGCPAAKTTVLYNGVDLATFTPDPTLHREPVVLFVGRLVEKKGVEYLLQAMATVQAQRPEIGLVVIGDGPLRSPLIAQAQILHLRCEFLGVQPHDTVRHWMNRAKLLAAPSVTAVNGDTEGLPNVVAEAQAMALPVVSTRHAGIPELVVHGQTGLLGPERHSSSLAEHILTLVTDEPLWQRCAAAARRRVETHFDRYRSIQTLEALYDRTLAQWPH